MAGEQETGKKSNKKTVIIIAVIAIVVIIVISIFLILKPSSEGTGTSSAESSGSAGSAGSVTLTEEQTYAEFEAELTCEILKVGSAEDIVAVMEKTASVMEKYDYDNVEYNRLKAKYGDDEDFKALIVEEMEDMCPELIE